MDLRKVEDDLDQLLETLVSRFQEDPKDDHRERKLRLANNNLSDKFRKKWSEKFEEVESIHCEILK